MAKVVVAADGKWIRDQVRTALASSATEVFEVTRGQDVRVAVAEHAPDLVVLDMQIGNMGGVAVAIDLRLEESGGRLDREADRFLAKRAAADAELVKPLDAGTLRRTLKRLLGADAPV